MVEDRDIAGLREILGDKGLLTEPSVLQGYESGARGERGRAAFVARPASTGDVSRVMAYAARRGLKLVPQSGNTGLVAASVPDGAGDVGILSLERLKAAFEVDPANRTVRAGAGMRLSDLNARLVEHGLFFPIDLSADPCLGGMVATNTGGARFLRYGDVRRNTLGLTVVLGDEDGSVLELGSPLRKNNTGIDWKQLFIGTSGAFGVITECVLSLEPVSRQAATALLVPADADGVADLLIAMEAAFGPCLTAFEGMSKNAMAAALAHAPALRNPFANGVLPDFAILAEVSRSWPPRAGEQPLEDAFEEVLAEIWQDERGLLADALIGRPEDLFALRHAISEGVQKSGRLIAFDLAFRRGEIMRFLSHMKAVLPLSFPNVRICDFGHVGDGGVHFNLVVAHDDARLADPDFEAELRDFVFSVAVGEFSGSFSAEHGIGPKNQAYYDRFTPHTLRQLARGLKAMTSPAPLGAVTF